jgi:hypothetical protein
MSKIVVGIWGKCRTSTPLNVPALHGYWYYNCTSVCRF